MVLGSFLTSQDGKSSQGKGNIKIGDYLTLEIQSDKGGNYLGKYIRYVLNQPCLPILDQSLAEYHSPLLWPVTNENTEKWQCHILENFGYGGWYKL